jgi:hypothetical protein
LRRLNPATAAEPSHESKVQLGEVRDALVREVGGHQVGGQHLKEELAEWPRAERMEAADLSAKGGVAKKLRLGMTRPSARWARPMDMLIDVVLTLKPRYNTRVFSAAGPVSAGPAFPLQCHLDVTPPLGRAGRGCS